MEYHVKVLCFGAAFNGFTLSRRNKLSAVAYRVKRIENGRRLKCEAPNNIYIPPGRRAIHEDRLADLMKSLQAVGLLTPIVVRCVDTQVSEPDGEVTDGAYQLVIGRHRLEAARRLGWDEIECEVVDVSDRLARMLEIAENLHRAELTALERAEQTAEWLRLAGEDEADAEDAAEKPGQTDQVFKGGRGNEGGLSAAARILDIDRSRARRAVKIDSLALEAKEAAKIFKLDDHQTALLEAAAQPTKEAQVESLRQRAERRSTPTDQEPRQTDPPTVVGAVAALVPEVEPASLASALSDAVFLDAAVAEPAEDDDASGTIAVLTGTKCDPVEVAKSIVRDLPMTRLDAFKRWFDDFYATERASIAGALPERCLATCGGEYVDD